MKLWWKRTTRLLRDVVEVGVLSYPDSFTSGWRTVFMVYEDVGAHVSHVEHVWRDANDRHETLVKIAQRMGYTVISDVWDGKEKMPVAENTAQGKEYMELDYSTDEKGTP